MKRSELISQRDATAKSWGRFLENRSKEWGLAGHDMGIHPFNMRLGGWIPTKVTTIGARSGTGKTAMLCPMFAAGKRVLNGRRAEFLFFTWETESSFLVDRHICYRTGLSLKMLNQGARLLGEQTLGRIKDAYKDASTLPVTYQQHTTNIKEVRALSYQFAEDCKKKEEIEGVKIQPVIVVDYIGLAQFEGAGLRTYGIADFMNGIKQTCNETGASGLILTQISRKADEKEIPDRTDFADSQSIEMASDNLVLLHRPEYNKVSTITDPDTGIEVDSGNKMLVRVLKGRDYGTGDSLINCDVKYFRFWDISHEFDADYWKMYSDEDFWREHFGFTNINEKVKLKVS